MRFDGLRQLRRQENVLLCSRMVQVDQHPALSVWLVEGVVGVRAARLAVFFLVSGLAADVEDGVIFTRAQVDDIWINVKSVKEKYSSTTGCSKCWSYLCYAVMFVGFLLRFT